MAKILLVGMGVHAQTIAVAVAEQDGEVRSPNRMESIRKLIGKLGGTKRLRVRGTGNWHRSAWPVR